MSGTSNTKLLQNGQKTKDITTAIQCRVKQLANTERFKLCVHVVMGDVEKSSLKIASRCVWNDKWDTYVQHTHVAGHCYAVATVYAIYFE